MKILWRDDHWSLWMSAWVDQEKGRINLARAFRKLCHGKGNPVKEASCFILEHRALSTESYFRSPATKFQNIVRRGAESVPS